MSAHATAKPVATRGNLRNALTHLLGSVVMSVVSILVVIGLILLTLAPLMLAFDGDPLQWSMFDWPQFGVKLA